MPKFKILSIKNKNIYLNENDIKHITKSLRKKNNQEIICFDDCYEYFCIIKNLNPFLLEFVNKKEINKKVFNINIFLAIINKNNFELAVQKLNEINCRSVTPVFFERSQKNIFLNLERLEKIIFESSKQCNRNKNLIMNAPISFEDLIIKIKKYKYNILAYQFSNNPEIEFKNISNENINLIIGPEGGFSENELKKLKNECYLVKLNTTILRSETAAISLASIISYEMSKND